MTLKFFNGNARNVNLPGAHVSVAAASRTDAVRAIEEAGGRASVTYLKSHWSPCWGTLVKAAVPTPERGVWVERRDGKIERLL